MLWEWLIIIVICPAGESGDSEVYDYEQSEPESESGDENNEEDGGTSESKEDPVSSDEDQNERGANGRNGDKRIRPGGPITPHESVLAIFSLSSFQHLSGTLIALILKLIALHCPDGSIVKKTLCKFKKYFTEIGESFIVYHFCADCIYPLALKESVCKKCKKTGNVSFFLELPLVNQLQIMFKRRNFFEDLQYRFRADRKSSPDNIDDIYDGSVYKGMMNNGGFLSNPNNISCMRYSDGVKVFKSSKFSIWPFCLVINELCFKKRSQPQNILLAGLWFSRSKPNSNLFLKPLKKAMTIFSRKGRKFLRHDGSEILVKAKILCGTCDLPAKTLFHRFKQYNSYFGCLRCLSAGAREAAGKTTVQVYPFEANVNSSKYPRMCRRSLRRT